MYQNDDATMRSLSEALSGVPVNAAKPLARILRDVAQSLDLAAAKAAEDNTDVRAALEELKTIPEKLEWLMDLGEGFEFAVAALHRKHGWPVDTIHHYWKRHLLKKGARDREERNIRIMRQVRRGHTDASIAKREGVSPRTVQRVIRRSLRDNA